MDTIEYYNKYAAKIFEDTAELDMEKLRQKFLKYLEEGDSHPDHSPAAFRLPVF